MEPVYLKKVIQQFDANKIDDIEAAVIKEMEASGIRPAMGSRIAITAGSRGVANIARVLKAAAAWLKSAGAKPFIIPAMGSHGGATADGQLEVLRSYGVTEDFCQVPILSSMEVVELPQGELENQIFIDRHAYEADGIIVVNRIKPHTDFHGEFESGLLKMCVIGLGKHRQALAVHRHGVRGLRELIPPTARQILKTGRILMGIGLVENAYDETAVIKAMGPEKMEEEEKTLLAHAWRNMPALPVERLDLLIVDEMGKDISGVGMDTNIIGRIGIKGERDPKKPRITNILARDLTEASHGNALGIGLADIITRNLYDKIDFRATYENVVTSTFLERGKLPVVADDDGQALDYALRTSGPISPDQAGIIRIKNTLHLGEIHVSASVWDLIKDHSHIVEAGDYEPLLPSGAGSFKPF